MKFNYNFLLILAMSLGLVSCMEEDYGIHGNGDVVEEVRQIELFEKLIINGPFQVTVEASDSNELTISGESNILPHISTDVIDGTLYLDPSYHETLYVNEPLIVSIPAKVLNEIEMNGYGEVTAPAFESEDLHIHLRGGGIINSGVNAEKLFLVLSGSGEINLTGVATDSEMFLEGTGELNAFETELQTLDIRIFGAVDANVNVAVELDVEIEGSGDVIYMGDPDVDSNLYGSGTVRKKE